MRNMEIWEVTERFHEHEENEQTMEYTYIYLFPVDTTEDQVYDAVKSDSVTVVKIKKRTGILGTTSPVANGGLFVLCSRYKEVK